MIDPFESRWVPRPSHVTPIADSLPAGFEAAAGSAAIKPSGKPDLALIRCDSPESVSARRQTRSSAAACASAVCDDGGPFVAALERDNIMACQFHPEKSQMAGAKLVQNFVSGAGP